MKINSINDVNICKVFSERPVKKTEPVYEGKKVPSPTPSPTPIPFPSPTVTIPSNATAIASPNVNVSVINNINLEQIFKPLLNLLNAQIGQRAYQPHRAAGPIILWPYPHQAYVDFKI